VYFLGRVALKNRRKTERYMVQTGKYNAVTDVEGILVGNYTDLEALSGVTVVICSEGAVAGVDVRGSAPGTRETDLLRPENLVERVQAVVLSGGSVYGLAAADGVVRWLSERGSGFPLDGSHVAPIVPAAVLFDLGRGKSFIPPISSEWGKKACLAAGSEALPQGCVGAGTGALSGAIKGGLGTASVAISSGITVGALVAVNSLGSVIDPATGRPWEIRLELDGEFAERGKRSVILPEAAGKAAARSTTIGVVATDAALSKVQAQKVAQMAHDGLARAIRPAHTMFDGDTLFCLATGKRELAVQPGVFAGAQAQAINELGHAAADCVSRAIMHGVLSACSLNGMIAFRDLAIRPVNSNQ
jgi:L-aminopeptidase/D-esterase-like protein